MRCILRNFSFREKLIFLASVMFFIAAILGILQTLDQSLAIEIPKNGGTLTEGIIGIPRFINPLLAISDADRDLVSLIYSGLMRSDGQSGLMHDLAEKHEISSDGLSYTFTLKENLRWPDKKSITSDDIIFTIQQAKNPALKSNQRASWEGVDIEKIDSRTIKFSLKRPYAPFMENMTIGIMPKHIWEEMTPEQINFADFNIVRPLGSGPYKISKIIKDSTGIIQSYLLQPNKYFALGKPYIKNIVLKLYPSERKLITAYEMGEIDSFSGISPQSITNLNQGRSEIKKLLLPRVFAVFFNQNSAPVLANKEVRQALELATDKEKIIKDVLKDYGSPLDQPFPPGIMGFDDSRHQEDNGMGYGADINQAAAVLEKAGWKFNEKNQILEKQGKKKETIGLEFALDTSDAPELAATADLLKSMWSKIGAKVDVKIFEIGDLNQNIIRPRKYDALLFGIMTGRDPDPFAFWHSSQRNDPGLNIALYTNIVADKLLEEARALTDIQKREEKYRLFKEQIEKDNPAIFLYAPEYIYLLPKKLKGVNAGTIAIPSERFNQIYQWHIETKKIWSKK